MSFFEEYWATIRSYDTEEKLDLYFYRPIGFVIAKIAKGLRLTPTQLTLSGLVIGVGGGVFFSNNTSTVSLLIGAFLVLFSQILDSADGQLARLTGRSSKLGLVLDGICDSLVFSSVYLFATLTLVPVYGYKIFIISVVALICHAKQSAMLDFYNREYIYFGYGKTKDDEMWNLSLAEARADIQNSPGGWSRFLNWMRLQWLIQQHLVSTRTDAERACLRELVLQSHSEAFQQAYRNYNRLILRFWRLLGPNFHTIMILVFVFLRRFDLYLIVIDLASLNVVMLLLRCAQATQDRKLFSWIQSKHPVAIGTKSFSPC